MSLSQQISLRVPITSLITRHAQITRQRTSNPIRNYSDTSSASSTSAKDEASKSTDKVSGETKPRKKTQAELDQELLAKLQGHEDDGGAAGIEYEDGKPVSMKRSVKNNMFRYI
jgi:hypothetical protein